MISRYRLAGRLLTLVALLFAAGCETVHFELTPPKSTAGRACVTQCAAIREACHGNELRRLRISTDACERRADSVFHNCLADADTPEKRKMCEISRPTCWAVEEPGRCENDYRACYVQCGGRVDRIVSEH
jgi:hypothetical protein